MPIDESDKSYVKTAWRSVWFRISLTLGLIGLLERWLVVHLLIPHWAIFSLIIVSLIGAHFEVYKKKFAEVQILEGKLRQQNQPKISPKEERQIVPLTEISGRLNSEGKKIVRYISDFGSINRTSLENVGHFSPREINYALAVCLPAGLLVEGPGSMIAVKEELRSSIEKVLASDL